MDRQHGQFSERVCALFYHSCAVENRKPNLEEEMRRKKEKDVNWIPTQFPRNECSALSPSKKKSVFINRDQRYKEPGDVEWINIARGGGSEGREVNTKENIFSVTNVDLMNQLSTHEIVSTEQMRVA